MPIIIKSLAVLQAAQLAVCSKVDALAGDGALLVGSWE